MQPAYTIFPLGDSALTIDFGNWIDEDLNEKVRQLFHQLRNVPPFLIDVIPAYSSLTLYYDAHALWTSETSAFEAMKRLIEPLIAKDFQKELVQKRVVTIPVCYSQKFALDLEELAKKNNLTKEEVIQLHTSKTYRVYMIGFLPGFAYMGKVDDRIATPRRVQPRKLVPGGAVGIAGEQTGIYPLASPGGWNIIGRTPLKLFDTNREEATLLQSGDEISFYSITEDEFEDYQSRTT
ncbi:MAG: 5-oxoprolinase subunit PxpB [Chitinophagaceae bacterium]|nr:MAG: 5-oxoprolinase subunit PxpB [Chitinophagaceae bacterium]